MGSTQSSVVHADEIGIHIQKIEYFSNPLIGSLRFNVSKPFALNSLPDDAWAALQLRIDPLAQRLTLPSRALYGLGILTLMSGAVLINVIYPSEVQEYEDDDLDEYLGSGASADRKREEEKEMQGEEKHIIPLVLITLPLFICLNVATATAAINMSRTNERVDEQIHVALDEIAPRLAFQGFSVEYRTQHTSFCQAVGTTPERVIVFRQLFGVGAGAATEVMSVAVPKDAQPGTMLSVIAPSGMLMQVSIPEGVQPGQEFSVHIPVQTYQKVAALGHLQ